MNELVEEIEEVHADPEFDPVERDKPISFDRAISTGSTLLDLAISGERIRGGGIPGGVMVEVFGPESVGKTALLAEVMTSAQRKSPPGEIHIDDPEGRFSLEHSRIYGMDFPERDYNRPDTVDLMFDGFERFGKRIAQLEDAGISVYAADSLAALSTKQEMEDEDLRGQERAKRFSSGLRKHTRRIHQGDLIFLCSNQVRETDTGLTTPGGRAIRFYSDFRLSITRPYSKWRVERTAKLRRKVVVGGKEVMKEKEITQQIGIISGVRVIKSSEAIPFREANIFIEFGYGFDDVRGNLQWLKEMTMESTYGLGKARAVGMDQAIQKIEDNDLESDLKNEVIDLWEEIQEKFKIDRKRKER